MNKEKEKRMVAQTMALVEALKKIAEPAPLDDPVHRLNRDYAFAYDGILNRLKAMRKIARDAIDTWLNL